MSFDATEFRPFARCGWGGRAASHFRGAIALERNNLGMQDEDPQMLGVNAYGQIGAVVQRRLGAASNTFITGVTRDSSGAALGNCTVHLFITGSDTLVLQKTSDASGNFNFEQPGSGPFYVVAYKPGSPDVAGTTLNTLVAT